MNTRHKQKRLREMISNAIKRGIRFDYLLVDSWFTCKGLVHFIKSRHIKCHFLGMIKMGNTKYRSKEYGDLTAIGCIDKLKRIKVLKTRFVGLKALTFTLSKNAECSYAFKKIPQAAI